MYAAKPIENAACCIYETIVSSDKEIHEKNMVFNEVIKVCLLSGFNIHAKRDCEQCKY